MQHKDTGEAREERGRGLKGGMLLRVRLNRNMQ